MAVCLPCRCPAPPLLRHSFSSGEADLGDWNRGMCWAPPAGLIWFPSTTVWRG